MIVLLVFIVLAYFILILFLENGYQRVGNFEEKNHQHRTSFTIIIPFRNEEERLPELIESLANITYDSNRHEIIFVDDESTDNSVAILHQMIKEKEMLDRISILQNKRIISM